jgi:hypothetical protein
MMKVDSGLEKMMEKKRLHFAVDDVVVLTLIHTIVI